MSTQIKALHDALIAIVCVMNRVQRDESLVKEAELSLDRALFPLLVVIERRGPINVGDLADRVGRDHTTVSRQVAKLESLGLVLRQDGEADRRVRDAIVTEQGKAMTDALDAARERMSRKLFANWDEGDRSELVRLLGKFADDLQAFPRT